MANHLKTLLLITLIIFSSQKLHNLKELNNPRTKSSDLGSHFSTNPNGQRGVEKRIIIDGTPSGWEPSMKIAQGIANNDPRVFCHWSMHEIAIDDYALYAAYDDDNLYLMWEMINLSDVVAKEDFPISQGRLSIYNLPIFIYLNVHNTGNHGTVVGGKTLWDSGITIEENVDTIIALSTNGCNGPFIYHYSKDLGAFPTETDDKGAASGIKLMWSMGILDTNVYGLMDVGADNRNVNMDYDDNSKWIDFYSETNHRKDLDMTYEMSVPLKKLGITKEDLVKNGIGIVKVSTFGTSGMDSLPYDKSMSDNAHKPYSKDPSTSMEKEDEDHITCKLARIGGPEL